MLEGKHYTVLLLSAPIGSGHRLAAEAIAELLREDEQLTVVHGNIFSFFPGFLGTGFLKSYLWILDKCPCLYALAYKWGNKESGSLWLRGLVNNLLLYLGTKYLNNLQPDAVISTHATPAGIISLYKKKHPALWQGAVVTDFTIHRWWVNPGIDTYFLADERLSSKVKTTGEILATGIPIRKDFLSLPSKEVLRLRYGWDNYEKICLIIGGGEGLLPMEEIIEAIMSKRLPQLRLVAITGNNDRLAMKLIQRFDKDKDWIEIHHFRKDVPELMAASDMIISKAGGLTSAEILASGLAYIIYKPLPGQEQGNAKFLSEVCHARVAHNIVELSNQVADLLKQETVINTRAYGHPDAVLKIAQVVKSRLN